MSFQVYPPEVRAGQKFIRTAGQPVSYLAAGETVPREVYAIVRYLNAVELANAIEAYPLEVTFDARDFAAQEPRKGDAVTIDGARRAVMQVRERRGSGYLIHYRCGVAG